ncbi:SDR family oxidoreductase [Flammeovirgaceae bacterium SG7u.111]|nr:SDR family oxidoreductase [Flammeovirgaceae bacterium SG7u.132]WPO33043.1 SDR family oxidoreductase [Flammeovirgaceae bacterium SG7u.111]
MKNKIILLTGATSGIGRSLAKQLAAEGAILALCGRSEEKMASLLEELSLPKGQIFSKCFSITSEEEIIRFVEETNQELGNIDTLINCAGANSARGKVEEMKTEDLDYMYALNFRAPMIFMREAYKKIKAVESGTIVNILSTVCLFSNEGIGAYTATKSGLDSLTKVFRKEARKDGVKVISVYPGGVDTDFRAADRPEYLSPEPVAESIVSMLKLPAEVHELVLRPMVEENF